MKLIFPVPPEADGALLRNFLRRCAVSTELARAVKFHGSGFWTAHPGEPPGRSRAGHLVRTAC